MTQKTALSLALFATLGMTACTVDAPTSEDFNYSFLEELPGAPDDDRSLEFHAPVDAQISLHFRDGLDGRDFVDGDVSQAILLIEGVQVAEYEHGEVVWRTISLESRKVDLMALAEGEVEELARGPISSGEYAGVALRISDSWVVDTAGREIDLKLPGEVLLINEKFALHAGESADLSVNFGGLQDLMYDGEIWRTEPVPSLEVEYD